jgi:hypothetical protein
MYRATFGVWVAALVVGLIGILSPARAFGQAAGSPPSLNVPDRDLLATHIQLIDARIKYWADKIAKGKDDEVVAAKSGLLQDYAMHDSIPYRYAFAKEAATILTPLLKLEDRNRVTNAAIALSRMQQVTIQPALEAMVVNPNSGVRYLGWKGYNGIRLLLLGQGADYAGKMFASLAKAAADEESPVVLIRVFQTLQFAPGSTANVTDDVLRDAAGRAAQTLAKAWPKRARQVLAGNVDTMDACTKGLATVQILSEAAGADNKAGLKPLIQMTVDVAYAAARAFDDAGASGPVAEAAAPLLRECEATLNAETKANKNPIEQALNDTKATDRGAAVRRAVLSWVDLVKKDYGVSEPSFEPATRPAASSSPAKAGPDTTTPPK